MSVTGDVATASLRAFIYANSQQNPDAVALIAPECQPMTYGRLSGHIDYVGSALRSRGIGRADRVAVVLPNGPVMATAFLGTASYAECAPLNPSYRQDEFEFYFTDLEVKAVIVAADTDIPARHVATRLGVAIIEVELPPHRLAGDFTLRGAPYGNGSPRRTAHPTDCGKNEDIALVLHTSGTTSRPKQVPLSHRSLCASARHIVEVLRLSREDRCLNVMPLFHIHGLVGVLLSSILAGGSVVCSAGFDSRIFADLMRQFQPTWYSAVPTIHQSILALAKANPEIAESGHLRLIRSSSSALPPSVMAELEERFRVPVIESYGMTEAAHQMASNPLPPLERKAGSVGLPAGPEMAIMDEQGTLLPEETIGEIVIRGRNVTAGYHNNSEANAAAFVNGWFRTGDLGRKDDAGYFYLTGRKKEMINRGGEKISPREIDEALLEHPAVAQAVAFASPHPTLGEDLAAAVVLNADGKVSERELRQFLFQRLAAVKVPSRILIVAAIPKGPTGKLQRIGLHQTLSEELHADYVPPRTELEKSIVSVMEQILSTSRVGVNDNFFALGGDSLKAIRVLAQLSTTFQIQLPAVTLFMYPTATELGLEITRILGEDSGLLEELLDEIEGLANEKNTQ
jgi:acyl-CoA synthetase (AMP-forming)/AMP-acid ligase II